MSKKGTMVVFSLDSKETAKELLTKLRDLDLADDNVEFKEAAFAHKVSRGRVKLEQFDDLGGGRGALGGGTIGLIAGTILVGPLGAAVGGVVGAAVAGLYTRIRDSGVNDSFMKEVGHSLDAGRTALFIMYEGEISPEMVSTMKDYDASLIYGTLPAEVETVIAAAYEEASGEEVVPEIEAFTAEATEADTEPVEEVVAPLVALAATPVPEVEETPPVVVVEAPPVPEVEETPPVVVVEAPPVPEVEETPPPVVAEVPTPPSVPTPEPAPDNFTVLDGIGPKAHRALVAAGITSYSQLAHTSEMDIRAALAQTGMVPPKNLESWPRQARLAAEGDWKTLYQYNAKRKLAGKTATTG
jgi:uncharacterized membrane protein/predicted flap endonuclease-1-like 5' DNA nuclease